MKSIEQVKCVKEVNVRRAKRSFGPRTLPYLRARANEIVAGPEYLLTRHSDEETIWECAFKTIIQVPNRAVRAWSIFVPANEREENGDAAMVLRTSCWRTDVDLREQTWTTTDEPSVDSQLGVFRDGLSTIVRHLAELDGLVYSGAGLDPRPIPVEWEELSLERLFAGGAWRLTIGPDVSNQMLEKLAHSLSEDIESLLADPNTGMAVDSMDVVYPGT